MKYRVFTVAVLVFQIFTASAIHAATWSELLTRSIEFRDERVWDSAVHYGELAVNAAVR